MQVHKFGGASVKDAASVQNLADIVSTFPERKVVIVVSAMDKTTNALEQVVELFLKRDKLASDRLFDIKNWHLAIIAKLDIADQDLLDQLNDVFIEAEWLLEDEPQDEYDYIYDQVIAIGELASSLIVHKYLMQKGIEAKWMDARDLIKCDDNYREGNVDLEWTMKACSEDIIPILESANVVTQGFIGGTAENNTITLGREGSDYSGAIFAHCLNASHLTVWKDVPGIMTCDPAHFDDAQLIAQLSYEEALEMTYYGAKVIHPKTIRPLHAKGIELRVRSFKDAASMGTIVGGYPELDYPKIKVLRKDLVLIKIVTKDYSFIVEDHLKEIFSLLVQHQIKLAFMKNLAISFTMLIHKDVQREQRFREALAARFDVDRDVDVKLLTLRHYDEEQLTQTRADKQVLLEERNQSTAQFVVLAD